MTSKKLSRTAIAASALLPLLGLGAATAGASPTGPAPGAQRPLRVSFVLDGRNLRHSFKTSSGAEKSAPLTDPDDLTSLGSELFVAFQNGVGPQGQPATSGNTLSTVVGFTASGRVLEQWDVTGHADGLTADPATGRLIATVNEDANSSLFVIDPRSRSVEHYRYNRNPLPQNGGTDAISIFGDRILISASAPGTPSAGNPNPPAAPQPQYPAVYSVSLDPQTLNASVSPLFFDEATATAADGPNRGAPVRLGLTDPDSNEVVPGSSHRFSGDFVLDSQGDQEQIYVSDPGGPTQHLSVLSLGQSIDDTAWAGDTAGALYASDSSTDTVDAVTGAFDPGTAFVAVTPCGANSAPSPCTERNWLGMLNLQTGHISPVALSGPLASGDGLIFVAGTRSSALPAN